MATPDPTTRPSPPPPPTGPERKRATPLLWILLLLALLAFGWFIYSQRSGITTVPEPAPPPAIEIGDGQDAAAERERAADDARRAAEESRDAADTAQPAPPERDATPLTRVEPEYPLEAYRKREEGTVLVSARLDAEGKLLDAQLQRRSGSRELDQAALDAVRQWTFEPAIRDGKVVASEVEVPVTFRIDR